MNQTNKILPNNEKVFLYSFGNILPKFISFATIPLFSFFLSKKDIGTYDLLLGSISLFIPIITFQLGDAYYRWMCKYGKSANNSKDILKTVIVFTFYSHLIFSCTLYILIKSIEINFPIWFLPVIFSSSIITLFQFVARAYNNIKIYSASGIINSAGIISFSTIYFFSINSSLNGIIYSYFLSNILTLFYLVIKLKLYQKIHFGNYNHAILKELLFFSIPLIPNALSWWLVSISNRYIIAIYMGVEANGLYAVASKIPSILFIFNSVFLLLFQDIVFNNLNKENDESYYSEFFSKVFTLQISLSIVIIAFSKILTKILFSTIYLETYKIVPIILLGVLLTNFSAFWGIFYLEKKKTIGILTTSLLGAIINIFFTYLMIEKLGLYSAALGTVLGFITILLIRIKQMREYIKIKFNYTLIISLFIFFIFSVIISQRLYNSFLEIVFMGGSLLLFYFYNHLLIRKTATQIKTYVKLK